MDRLDLDLVRARLAARGEPQDPAEPGVRAAVAIVLRGPTTAADGPELLLIRRAEDPRDPWSGHMAFPGGRQDPEDRDLVETAVRETLEEVGLDLRAHGERLGRLPDLPAIARGKRVGLVISPQVFAVRGDPALVPNHEVAEIVWTDLLPIARGERRTLHPYVHEGTPMKLPAHRVGERIVWGLTFQMIESFLALLR